MTSVLFIANQFPPRGGPGVHRSLNLVKHLGKFGFEPFVLTISEESIRRAGYTIDESLMPQVPRNTEIYRSPSYEPVHFIRGLMKLKIYRIFWFLFYPFLWEWSALWPFMIQRKAKQIIKEHSIKLIYTSSGPFSSLLLGLLLKRRGVKWVADLRDPFTDAYAWSFPSRFHWLLMRYLERKLLNAPDVLIVNTDAVKRLYEKRGIRKGKPIVVINNGY